MLQRTIRGPPNPQTGSTTVDTKSPIQACPRERGGDLAIRPVFHQLEARVEAHVFIAFLAYCLHVTLARRLHALAPGPTPSSVLEKFAAMQMIDLHLPTTDGRELLLTRYTEPEPELKLLLKKLKLDLPPTTTQNHCRRSRVADPPVVPTFGGPP
jgi:hypothetical protein